MLGRSLLTDTEDADIHIFREWPRLQLNWLKQALYGINKDKISHLIWIITKIRKMKDEKNQD
jgi:hypothetical protein